MRTWRRATVDLRCGRCGETIAKGDAHLVLLITAVKTPKLRCETCAGYPAPDDLPAVAESGAKSVVVL